MKPLRRLLAGLTIATAAAAGTLTVATTADAAPADTTWGAPSTDHTNDTTWGTPPTDDTGGDGTAVPNDTTWG